MTEESSFVDLGYSGSSDMNPRSSILSTFSTANQTTVDDIDPERAVISIKELHYEAQRLLSLVAPRDRSFFTIRKELLNPSPATFKMLSKIERNFDDEKGNYTQGDYIPVTLVEEALDTAHYSPALYEANIAHGAKWAATADFDTPSTYDDLVLLDAGFPIIFGGTLRTKSDFQVAVTLRTQAFVRALKQHEKSNYIPNTVLSAFFVEDPTDHDVSKWVIKEWRHVQYPGWKDVAQRRLKELTRKLEGAVNCHEAFEAVKDSYHWDVFLHSLHSYLTSLAVDPHRVQAVNIALTPRPTDQQQNLLDTEADDRANAYRPENMNKPASPATGSSSR